jgi:outer membrane protein OmpA-like peptidoglycan-associated protein
LGVQEDLSVTGILSDSTTGNLFAGRKILLTDQFGEVYKHTRTNDEGKFKFTDVPSIPQLYLRLENGPDQTELIAVITDLTILEMIDQEAIHTENIYFDFDHYRIRPEGRKVLDELANHLIRNQGVQVEIFAYADDRGTSEYNLQLTRKRGQAVADYLAQKGVDQTGLAIIAKGKQSQKEVDVELQRQFNRRVEFYLNGTGEVFKESARMYILKKKTDWATLSLAIGASMEELKALNGATQEEQLKTFQPVRLPVSVKKIPEDLFFIVI